MLTGSRQTIDRPGFNRGDRWSFPYWLGESAEGQADRDEVNLEV